MLLFVRPANGVYLRPKVVRLKGKSFVDEIAVVKKDMPNFFVEAMTISAGKVHTEVKEIVVPPESRVLDVAVKPSAATFKPGEKATVQVKLTDMQGKPFVGSTVLAVYDKSVEYISGGSNVQEIKEFFWKWRRSHSPASETSLERRFRKSSAFQRSMDAEPGHLWRKRRRRGHRSNGDAWTALRHDVPRRRYQDVLACEIVGAGRRTSRSCRRCSRERC